MYGIVSTLLLILLIPSSSSSSLLPRRYLFYLPQALKEFFINEVYSSLYHTLHVHYRYLFYLPQALKEFFSPPGSGRFRQDELTTPAQGRQMGMPGKYV